MKILNLKLTNLRNHTKLHLKFDSGITLITGNNGSGKSTILEAIHMLSTGRSKTSKYDRDLIQYGKDFCSINANIETKDQEFNMELQIIKNENFENASVKKAKINKVAKSMQYFTGIFNSVLFSPQDIQLITGSPAERRKYMDEMISQVDIEYKRSLNDYLKAVKQRNKLLEKINQGFGGQDEISFYTSQMLKNGQVIQKKREQMFTDIEQTLRETGEILNDKKTKLEVKYKKNEINIERLNEFRTREIAAMTSLLGPHRDDFEIYFNGHNVTNFGSRGEQRSCVLSLKISEISFIEEKKNDRPALLLDDIFSELDKKHQTAVFSVIKGNQTTITSTSTTDFLNDKHIQIINL